MVIFYQRVPDGDTSNGNSSINVRDHVDVGGSGTSLNTLRDMVLTPPLRVPTHPVEWPYHPLKVSVTRVDTVFRWSWNKDHFTHWWNFVHTPFRLVRTLNLFSSWRTVFFFFSKIHIQVEPYRWTYSRYVIKSQLCIGDGGGVWTLRGSKTRTNSFNPNYIFSSSCIFGKLSFNCL